MTWLHWLPGIIGTVGAAGGLLWGFWRGWKAEREMRQMERAVGAAQLERNDAQAERDELARDLEAQKRGADLAWAQVKREQEVTRGLRQELIRAREQARKELAARADRAMAAAASGDPRPAGDLLRDVMREGADDHEDRDGASGAAADAGRAAPDGAAEAGGPRGSGG